MGFVSKLKSRVQLRPVRTVSADVARLRNALLSQNDLFRGMSPAEMDGIGNRLPITTASAGQLIYSPEETGEGLFLLKAGHVRIYRIAADGRKLVLTTLGPGAAFGEMSLLGQSMVGSFAEAIDDCTVCIMSRIDIEQIMLEHPAVAVRMTQLLSQRLRETEDMLERVAFQPVPVRLGRLLLSLADPEGEVAGYSHQDLADMVGTSRETVSRAIVELKTVGLVEVDRRCLRIIDAHRLEQRIGGG